MRIVRETILSLELPYRERLAIERRIFRGGDGPRVAVVSGMHGDELEGLYLCHRINQWLEDLASTQPEGLLGTVELYPALNPLGLDTLRRTVPLFDTEINGNFPGRPEGLLPQRIAHTAMKHLAGAALVVDVHASNVYLRELPQVRIAPRHRETLLPLAREINVDVVWVCDSAPVQPGSLAEALNAARTPCLVAQMGVGMRVTPDYAEQLLTGLLNAWKRLGVLAPGVATPRPEHVARIAGPDDVHFLNAQTSGTFISDVGHWNAVYHGQPLGHIVSPYSGSTLCEVRAPVDGVLLTLREYPLVYEGSLMARVVTDGQTP